MFSNAIVRKLPLLLVTLLLLISGPITTAQPSNTRVFIPMVAGASGPPPAPVRTMNVPYFKVADLQTKYAELGIFWFGQVRSTTNSVDVRVGYNDKELYVHVAVFDQRLWYIEPPATAAGADLTQWDTVELLLDTAGAGGDAPRTSSYRLISGFNAFNVDDGSSRKSYERALRGDGSRWTPASIAFTTTAGWRGDRPNNDNDDRGWTTSFRIPFSSLGVSNPEDGRRWALAVHLHDRDSAGGPPNPTSRWPEQAQLDRPASWGGLRFGMPVFQQPVARNTTQVTLRQGLDGLVTPDGDVGGGTVCGDNLDFWSEWGEKTYYTLENDPGTERPWLNVQNQSDVADWPCFSRYYINFPLNGLPPGKVIVSARLKLHLFGGSRPAEAKPSLIQLFRITDDWQEPTLTWNNAPLAAENYSGSWVPVLPEGGQPAPHEFDVSVPLSQAYQSSQPLRLALYTAASDYHSGKYFFSADTPAWNAERRPTLVITLGDQVTP